MSKLLEVKFGSQVYGTATPASDIDVGVVLLEPKEFIFGIANLTKKSTTIAQTVEGDTDTRQMYLRRFLNLCAQGNPNVIEWLYTPEEHIDYRDDRFYHYIWKNRHILLSKKRLVDSHMGFAHSQIIKMRRHEQDMGAKRRELYAKYGYDVKYASHAVRLMYQLSDLMIHGEIILPYQEAQTEILKAIKAGEWTLAEFDEYYPKLKDSTQMAVDYNDTMPNKVDFAKLAELMEQFYLETYYG